MWLIRSYWFEPKLSNIIFLVKEEVECKAHQCADHVSEIHAHQSNINCYLLVLKLNRLDCIINGCIFHVFCSLLSYNEESVKIHTSAKVTAVKHEKQIESEIVPSENGQIQNQKDEVDGLKQRHLKGSFHYDYVSLRSRNERAHCIWYLQDKILVIGYEVSLALEIAWIHCIIVTQLEDYLIVHQERYNEVRRECHPKLVVE